MYSVTFMLPGFSIVKREGIQLEGSFTASVNADLRVGALEETITVSGEAPTVDVQSATRQRVIGQELIEALPTGRNQFNLGQLIPGATATLDIGGSVGFDAAQGLTIHGSRSSSQRLTQNGVVMNAPVAGGYGGAHEPNPSSAQEITIDYSGISAESQVGGVQINTVPKEGGNTFAGTLFVGFANHRMQSNNLTQDLRDRGLRFAPQIHQNWDVNPGFGGPLRRDRIWFYGSYRNNGAWNYVPGIFYNKNTNNPNAWTYEADTDKPISRQHSYQTSNLRVTVQATQRNKVAVSYQAQTYCQCANGISASTAPEAGYERRWPLMNTWTAEWTAPLTNRLMFDAVALHSEQRWAHSEMWVSKSMFGQNGINPAMISVTDTGLNLMYRARNSYLVGGNGFTNTRASMSYITGTHAFKTGFNINKGHNGPNYTYATQPISYRFNNGVPNRITLASYDFSVESQYTEIGIFVQDKWTIGRTTVNAGFRYDGYRNGFPRQELSPTLLFPDRSMVFEEIPNLRWHDVTPRLGLTHDVFGSGKTALKVTLGKYLDGMPSGVAESMNPVSTIVTTTNRAWSDANRNYWPDCDLVNPAANGECLANDNANFGRPVSAASADPDLLHGFGKRGYNWEVSAGIQQELVPRVSVDVGYFRRWFGNFQVVDNLAVEPDDFTPFSVTAPSDPRLPGGGNYEVSGLFDINPAAFGRASSYLIQLSDKIGKRIENWHGVDATVNIRLANSLTLQGGLSAGRTMTDDCDVVRHIGRTSFGSALSGFSAGANDAPSTLNCRNVERFRRQIKMSGFYIIPVVDVHVAGTFQHRPGPAMQANYNATFVDYGPSLGRFLAGGNINSTRSVPLLPPNQLFYDGLNVLDLRFNKILRTGRTRMSVGVDFYNAFNSSTVLSYNNNFNPANNTWGAPQSIVTPRFAKLNMTLNF